MRSRLLNACRGPLHLTIPTKHGLSGYRAGLPVEQASASRTGCATWMDDGVFAHLPVNVDAFYADIDAAASSGG